jgi:hypothetical protein
VVWRSEVWHGDPLVFQVASRLHAVRPEQFVTADMDSSQQDNRVSRLHLYDEGRHERHADIDVARGEGLVGREPQLHILHFGETPAPEEFFGHVLRGHADTGDLREPDPRRLGRRFRGHWPGRHAQEPHRPENA